MKFSQYKVEIRSKNESTTFLKIEELVAKSWVYRMSWIVQWSIGMRE